MRVEQKTERRAPDWKRKTVTLCKEDSDKPDEVKERVFTGADGNVQLK